MLELELMELIYQGVDPRTGEVFHTPRDPALDKCRAAYLQALRKLGAAKAKRSKPALASGDEAATRPANQGAPWREADDEELRVRWASSEQPTVDELATHFGRNLGGITSRLLKLGVVPNTDAAMQESKRRKKARAAVVPDGSAEQGA